MAKSNHLRASLIFSVGAISLIFAVLWFRGSLVEDERGHVESRHRLETHVTEGWRPCYRFNKESRSFLCASDRYVRCDTVRWNRSEWAKSPRRIFHWDDVLLIVVVEVHRQRFADAVAESWAQRLDPAVTMLFAGGSGIRVPSALAHRPRTHIFIHRGRQGYDHLDELVHAVFSHAVVRFSEKRFLLKLDDDAYLIPDHLGRFLSDLSASVPVDFPVYFGKGNCANKSNMAAAGFQTFCHAQGGCYGLTRPAARLLVEHHTCDYWSSLNQGFIRSTSLDFKHYEDVMVGRCLLTGPQPLLVTTCESFFPQNPSSYLLYDGNDIGHRLGQNPISFHHLDASAFPILDQLLYPATTEPNPSTFFNQDNLDLLRTICRKQGKHMICNHHDI